MAGVIEELESVADLCGRIRFSSHAPELVANLLAPVASFLRADTASFRAMSLQAGKPMPAGVVSLGIPRSVDDAYLTHYFKLDPARRLLHRALEKPLFADPGRPGEWSSERASSAQRREFRAEFQRYRTEFLLPNHFVHHLGFCFGDAQGAMLLFDFHRPAGAPPFGKLELAKASILATYLHAQVARGVQGERVHCGASGAALLSARELEVAEAVAFGLSNKEIAARLRISVRTVENHLRSIFAKLAVTTRTRLAAKLRETRLATGGRGTAGYLS